MLALSSDPRQLKEGFAVHQRRSSIVSLFVATVLSFALAAPWAVEGQVNDGGGAPVNVSRPGDGGVAKSNDTELSNDEGKQPSNKRGGLARILSAPFRALGRLFGGRKSRSDDAAEARRKEAEAARKAEAKASEIAKRSQAKTEEAIERDRARAASLSKRMEEAQAKDAEKAAARARAERRKADEQRRRDEERERRRVEKERQGAAGLEGARVFEQRAAAATAPHATNPSETELNAGESGTPQLLTGTAQQKLGAIIWKPYIENAPLDHLSQGRALLTYGYYNEAIAELSIASTVGPDLIEANKLLGQTYDRIGAYPQAQEAYERALSVAPANSSVLHALGHSLYLSGNTGAALRRLKQAARLAPNDTNIIYSTALVQVRLGKYNDALKSFARIEGEFHGRLKLAQALADLNLPKEAIKQYEAALRIQPQSPVVLARLAELYQRTGRIKDSEAARRMLAAPKNRTATGGW